MIFGPQKREIYDYSSKNGKPSDVDPVIKGLVIVVIVIGCVAAIYSTIFGHSWTPPS